MNIKVTYLRKEKAFIRGDKVVNQDDCVKEFNSIEDAKKAEIPAGYSVALFAVGEVGYFIRLIDSEWVFSSINKGALGNKRKMSESELENFCRTLDLNRPNKDFVVGEDYDENGNPLYRK